MVSCSVRECDVTRRNNPNQCTFHRFPSNPVLREKWIRVINRPDWTPSAHATICSKHFEEKWFLQRKHRHMLMKDSIPTLFVPIQLPRRRPVTSYVYRDIKLPSEVVNPSSNLLLSPSKEKLIERNKRLKRKLSEKNKALKNLKAKTIRMSKQIIYLQKVVKELNNRPGLENHSNCVEGECRENLLQKLIDRVNKQNS